MHKQLVPLSISNSLKNFIKKILSIIKILTKFYYFSIIVIFIFIAFLKLLQLIFSKEPDYQLIISYGERGTILIATLVVLTFTYALALENPKKNNVIMSGEHFLKSLLSFVIGIIFSMGIRTAEYQSSSLGLYFLFLNGFVMLFLSAIYLTNGLFDLLKSIYSDYFD